MKRITNHVVGRADAWLEMPERDEWLAGDYGIYATAYEQAVADGEGALLAKLAGVLALIEAGRVRCSVPGFKLDAPLDTPARGLAFLLRVADALQDTQRIAVREVDR